MKAVALMTALTVVLASGAQAQTSGGISLVGQTSGGMRSSNLPPAMPATSQAQFQAQYQPRPQFQYQPQAQTPLYNQYQSAGWNPAQLQSMFASQLFILAMLRQNQAQAQAQAQARAQYEAQLEAQARYQEQDYAFRRAQLEAQYQAQLQALAQAQARANAGTVCVDPRVYEVPQPWGTASGANKTYKDAEECFGIGLRGARADAQQWAANTATGQLSRSQRVAMLTQNVRAEVQRFMQEQFPARASSSPDALHRWLISPPSPKVIPSTRYEALAFAAGVVLGRIKAVADANGGRVPQELAQLQDAWIRVTRELTPNRYEPARFQRGDREARSAAGSLCEALGSVRQALQPRTFDPWNQVNV